MIHFPVFQTFPPFWSIIFIYRHCWIFPEVLSFYLKFPDFRKFPEKWHLWTYLSLQSWTSCLSPSHDHWIPSRRHWWNQQGNRAEWSWTLIDQCPDLTNHWNTKQNKIKIQESCECFETVYNKLEVSDIKLTPQSKKTSQQSISRFDL